MNLINIQGGCYCGEIRYNITITPKNSTICYCEDCRNICGAQSVAWITIDINTFAITKGVPSKYKSSPPVLRTFCGKCGTHLSYSHEHRPNEIDITTVSLDDPEAFPPRENSFAEEKISWAL